MGLLSASRLPRIFSLISRTVQQSLRDSGTRVPTLLVLLFRGGHGRCVECTLTHALFTVYIALHIIYEHCLVNVPSIIAVNGVMITRASLLGVEI